MRTAIAFVAEKWNHVGEEKDLGVVIDSELSFDEHVSAKVNKANGMVGLIRQGVYKILLGYNQQTAAKTI